MRKFITIPVFFILLSTALLAQDETPTRVTNQNRMGELPYSTSIGTDIEHVDLATGALNVTIPIWSVPGRGMDATLSFHWNSNFWMAGARTDAFGTPYYIYNKARDSGWQSNHAAFTFATVSTPCQEGTSSVTVRWNTSYIYYDEGGGQHPLALQTGGGLCNTGGNNNTGPDLSAMGLWGTVNGGLQLPDGTSVAVTTGSNPNPLLSSITYKDANGNTRSANTDTLGRPLYTAVDAPFDSVGRPTQTTFTVKDPNGSSQNIVVTWVPLTLSTNFGTVGVREATGVQWYAIKSILFPNGTSYQFQYEPDYGELTEIDLPAGGVVKYAWGNFTQPNTGAEIPDQESRRYVTSRTETVNGVSQTWTFQLSTPISGYEQDVVTYPPVAAASGGTVQNQSVFLSASGSVIDAKIYAGAATGTPVREFNMQYQSDGDPTVNFNDCSDSGTPSPFSQPMGSRLTRLITILDNGVASKKEFTYDSLPYTFYTNRCSTAETPQALQFTASRGNVTAIRDYGFGTASGPATNMDVPNAPLLRTTTRTYWHDSHSQYIAPNIVDRVATETVTDNVANAVVAQTQYSYDATAIQSTANLTSVPGHDSTFTSSVTTRGNPTLVQRWNNADNTWLPTTYTYDDLGNIRSIQDPKGNITSWLYDDSFDPGTISSCAPSSNSYAYVSKKTDPANHNFFVTRRACTGQVDSHKDDNDVANGIATTYSYDEMGRVLIKTLPNGGTVKNDYHNDAVPPFVTTTTAAAPDPDMVQDSHFDGLHRLVQTQLHAPGSNVIVDTSYGPLGRVASVSNPHGSVPASTDGSTSTIYDALSRPLVVTKQDASTVGYSYAGNKTTVTDEAGKQRASYTDSLGRLIEVDEPGDSSTGAQAQGDLTVGGSLRFTSVNATQATGSITISGNEGIFIDPGERYCADYSIGNPPRCVDWETTPSTTYYNSGTLTVYVNGLQFSPSYGSGSDVTSIANSLAGSIRSGSASVDYSNVVTNTTVNPPVATISLYARSAGTGGNSITLATGSSTYDSAHFSGTSFTPGVSGATLTGGVNGGITGYDSGHVALKVGSFTGATVAYSSSQNADPATLASAVASAFNSTPGAPATASAQPGSASIHFTYHAYAQAGNVAATLLTTDNNASYPGGSFSGSTTLAGGQDPYSSGIAHPFVTLYHYDTLGNLSCVEQHGDATGTGCPTTSFSPTSPVPPDSANPWRLRRFGYNSLGQLLWASNPESGVITYSYDLAGNVSQKTSPAPNQTGTATTAISYCYDAGNRLLAKGYSTSPNPPQQCSSAPPYLPNPAVVNTYDVGLNGIGHLTSLTDQAGSGSYTYDVMGRIKTEQRTIAGITKSISYGYDLAGFPTQITYPSTRVVKYTADSAGRAISAIDGNLTAYATAASYNAAGTLAGFASGSSITNSFLYNPRLQLCRITAWTSGSVPGSCTDSAVHGNLMDRGYNFSFGSGDNGNVLGITNYRDSSRSQSFTYDSLNRIVTGSTSGNTGALSWGENYTIDAWGNLQISPMAGKAHGGMFQHAGDMNNRASGLGYDAAGNLTNYTAPGQYVYDSENRLQSTAGMTYTYDADGDRVEKSNGSTGTLYWYGAPGILAESDLAGNIKSEYVFFDGKRTARVDSPGNTVHYYLSDHLNSTSMVVSAAGVPEEESDYSPFGTEYVVTGPGGNHYKFTGKERDAESGLDYFGKRFYGNWLGRWTDPDPAKLSLKHLLNPQKWNKYAYTLDNPLRYIDPDGQEEIEVQLRAFIPQKTVSDPLGHTFAGDNRGFSSSQNVTSRTSITVRIETDASVRPGNPIISVTQPGTAGQTKMLDKNGNVIKSATQNQGLPSVTGSRDTNGNAVLNFQENAKNPLEPQSMTPGIRANLNVTVTQNGTSVDVSGTVSGTPSFELNVGSTNVPLQTASQNTIGFGLGLFENNTVQVASPLVPPPPPPEKDK
jgi:RHS repeat-associated protein